MDWDSYRYFLALHRKKSLKLASRELKVNQTTVGRRILALESELGTKLFEKHSNGFFLTLAGERVLVLAEQIELQFLAMERQILGKDQRKSGVVRIAMPGAIANHFVISQMQLFSESYPDIEVQFLTGPEILNLSRREADLAIRLVRPQQSELLVRKIGSMDLAFYAVKTKIKLWKQKSYLEGSKIPFVGLYERAMSKNEKTLLQKTNYNFQMTIQSSAWSSVFGGVKAGIGVGVLPTFMGDKDTSLERFNEFNEKSSLWLVVHPEVQKSARIRVLISFLNEIFLSL